MQRYSAVLILVSGIAFTAAVSMAQNPGQRLELDRKGETIVLEPYAPNILRVTLSLQHDPALAKPGYGFVASPDASRLERKPDGEGGRVSVVEDRRHRGHGLMTLRCRSQTMDIAKYFNGSTPGAHITFRTPDGKKLLEMTGWSQAVPNHKDGTAELAQRPPADRPGSFLLWAQRLLRRTTSTTTAWGRTRRAFSTIAATPVRCWADYLATGGPSCCVPFLVTNKGYGLVWDNPSKTTIEPGFNEQTRWTSEVGDRVSFFVIAGDTADEIYAGYRLLTGPNADAAQGGLRLHPVQAALRKPGGSAGTWPRAIATAICPPMCWWWTGSTTPRWARWTSIRSTGPTRRR